MDIDRSHEIVSYVYLTADKGLFVNPQYPITIEGRQYLPDFLALEPAAQRAWIVEVSRSKDLRSLNVKCLKYAVHRAEVEAALQPLGLNGWSLGIWLVLRADIAEKAMLLAGKLNGIALRTTSLEEAVASWTWLNTDGLTRNACGS